jgi:hypothetical protein
VGHPPCSGIFPGPGLGANQKLGKEKGGAALCTPCQLVMECIPAAAHALGRAIKCRAGLGIGDRQNTSSFAAFITLSQHTYFCLTPACYRMVVSLQQHRPFFEVRAVWFQFFGGAMPHRSGLNLRAAVTPPQHPQLRHNHGPVVVGGRARRHVTACPSYSAHNNTNISWKHFLSISLAFAHLYSIPPPVFPRSIFASPSNLLSGLKRPYHRCLIKLRNVAYSSSASPRAASTCAVPSSPLSRHEIQTIATQNKENLPRLLLPRDQQLITRKSARHTRRAAGLTLCASLPASSSDCTRGYGTGELAH